MGINLNAHIFNSVPNLSFIFRKDEIKIQYGDNLIKKYSCQYKVWEILHVDEPASFYEETHTEIKHSLQTFS